MATLNDIQFILNRDMPRLKDQRYVMTMLWPQIKQMLTQVTDFNGAYPGDMRKLIYKWLNEQGLQGTPPAPINLYYLKGALTAVPRQVYVPEPGQVYKWLPW